MTNWFECKIKYEYTDDYGKTKSVSESYLVDAVSFTEAEARVHKLLDKEIPFNFEVAGIKLCKIDEIITSDTNDNKWYKARVLYIDIDESSGKEKKTGHIVFTEGKDLSEALDNIKQDHSKLMIDWEIESISLSKIISVFPNIESERELETK